MIVCYADTATQFRDEVVAELERMQAAEMRDMAMEHTQRDKRLAYARACAHRNAAVFFKELVIHPKEHT